MAGLNTASKIILYVQIRWCLMRYKTAEEAKVEIEKLGISDATVNFLRKTRSCYYRKEYIINGMLKSTGKTVIVRKFFLTWI